MLYKENVMGEGRVQWFKNLNIGKKLMVSFMIIVLITVLVGVVGIRNIQDIEVIDAELYEINTLSIGDIAQAGMAYQRIRVSIGQLISEDDIEKKKQYVNTVAELHKTMDTELNNFEKNIQSPEVRQEFNKLKTIQGKWAVILDDVLRLTLTGQNQAAYALYSTQGNQYSVEISQIIDRLMELQMAQAGQKAASNSEITKAATKNMFILLIVSFLVALTLVVLITRLSTNSVKELQSLMAQVEGGDLTVQGKVNSEDEMGKLILSFNKLVETMHHMNKEIYDTAIILNESSSNMLSVAEVVASNSEEMSAVISGASEATEAITVSVNNGAVTSLELSGNINSISAATEEISATIHSLASASEQASVNLDQVSVLVDKISGGINLVAGSAKDVSGSVTDVVTAVKEINLSLSEVSKNCERSISVAKDAEMRAQETTVIIQKLSSVSRQIGKVVNLINDIADQTNMLALNAAIEAAGAGDAGKGFAVVANEVKELAKQTSGATDEIANQIETMQEEMAEAVQAVSGITQVISAINDNSNNIAVAVTEQSAVVGDISAAVIIAAEKVNVISNEIGDIAEKSRDVARGAAESTLGVKEIARSVGDLSLTAGDLAKNTESASVGMKDVANASQKIAVNVEEIFRSINEMDKASNNTAAKGVQTTEAADKLVIVSNKLQELAKRFTV